MSRVNSESRISPLTASAVTRANHSIKVHLSLLCVLFERSCLFESTLSSWLKPTWAKPTLAKSSLTCCEWCVVWCVWCCVCGVCVVWRGCWFHGVGFMCGCWFQGLVWTTLSPGPPFPWTAQNFALFFPSPAAELFFSSLSGGLLVEFWWCFEGRALKCARLEFSGCCVKPRRFQARKNERLISKNLNY